MNAEYLRVNLYEKTFKEQEKFIADLKKLPPEEIIEKAYEYIMREDILFLDGTQKIPPTAKGREEIVDTTIRPPTICFFLFGGITFLI